MKKSMLTLLTLVASLSVSMAQTIVDTGFSNTNSPAYANGDLATQNGWIAAENTGANAFNVTDAAGDGFADTVAASFDTNSGNFVYLDTTALGNAVDDEWDGVMDFTISRTATNLAGGDIFRIGLSTTHTNALGTGADTTNQVPLRINVSSGGGVTLRSYTAEHSTDMLSINAATMGWDVTSDQETDQWRLSWKLRKTREADVYTMICDMENLDNPTNLYGTAVSMIKPEAYAGSTYYLMGHPAPAAYNETPTSFDVIDITIDNLSITKSSSVDPILYPTPVTADAGNAVVDLSWDPVTEAEDYVVMRILSGVTNNLTPAGITNNAYSDTTVVNGNDYYYFVTSRATGAADAHSDPVLAQPDAAATGTILDTTFAATNDPAYADGDLAGQNRWKSLTATAAPAFNVDSSGAGFAETATFSNDFSNVTGNQVYYNQIMSNEVNSAWSGSMAFSLQASPEPGLYATNMVGSTTNVQQIANMPKSEIFEFGLTSDLTTRLEARTSDDALITVRTDANADIRISLNGYNTVSHLMLILTREQLGWDPEWADGNETNAPIPETDPITIDWTIRKVALANHYMGIVDVTVGGTTYSSDPYYTDDSDPNNQPDELYAADLVYFGMSHHLQSQITNISTMVNVAVDALSLTHTNQSSAPVTAPYALSGTIGNLEIGLDWLGGFEAESFDVYRSEVDGGPYTHLTNTTERSYLDTGLTDLRTYFYVVYANYPGGAVSSPTDQLIFRARGVGAPFDWGGRTDVVTAHYELQYTEDIVGDISNITGTLTDGALAIPGVGDYTNAAALYGVMQKQGGTWRQRRIQNAAGGDYINLLQKNGPVISAFIYMKGSPVNMEASAHSYELTESAASAGNNFHAVVRDSVSGTWYVTDTEWDNNFLVTDLAAESWRVFDVADATSTELMSATNNPIAAANLSSVDAVGFLTDHTTSNTKVTKLQVLAGSAPTEFDLWTDSQGIYNEDAAMTNDYDADGLNNVWEWGLGGDPADDTNVGITERGVEMDDSGNLIYVYPRLKEAGARPDYFLTETINLVHIDFTEEDDYEVGTGSWPGESDFEAVTNAIPTTNTVMFIQLNIE